MHIEAMKSMLEILLRFLFYFWNFFTSKASCPSSLCKSGISFKKGREIWARSTNEDLKFFVHEREKRRGNIVTLVEMEKYVVERERKLRFLLDSEYFTSFSFSSSLLDSKLLVLVMKNHILIM